MSNKLYKLDTVSEDQSTYLFYCPACGHDHYVEVPRWEWNESMDAPTFRPSLLSNASIPGNKCHLFITKGMIDYLPDSDHSLSGQTIEMLDYDY